MFTRLLVCARKLKNVPWTRRWEIAPRNCQVRVCYWIGDTCYTSDIWTTEEIAKNLAGPEHVKTIEEWRVYRRTDEFASAVRALNPQMRYHQGFAANDWERRVWPHHVNGRPEIVGERHLRRPGQERLFTMGAPEFEATHKKPPLNLPLVKRNKPQKEKLFDDLDY